MIFWPKNVTKIDFLYKQKKTQKVPPKTFIFWVNPAKKILNLPGSQLWAQTLYTDVFFATK